MILKGIKRALFGAGAAARPMDDLLQTPPSGPAALLPEKMLRVRLVAFYHAVFSTLSYPAFYLMLLYYRLALPGVGLGLLAVARKTVPKPSLVE